MARGVTDYEDDKNNYSALASTYAKYVDDRTGVPTYTQQYVPDAPRYKHTLSNVSVVDSIKPSYTSSQPKEPTYYSVQPQINEGYIQQLMDDRKELMGMVKEGLTTRIPGSRLTAAGLQQLVGAVNNIDDSISGIYRQQTASYGHNFDTINNAQANNFNALTNAYASVYNNILDNQTALNQARLQSDTLRQNAQLNAFAHMYGADTSAKAHMYDTDANAKYHMLDAQTRQIKQNLDAAQLVGRALGEVQKSYLTPDMEAAATSKYPDLFVGGTYTPKVNVAMRHAASLLAENNYNPSAVLNEITAMVQNAESPYMLQYAQLLGDVATAMLREMYLPPANSFPWLPPQTEKYADGGLIEPQTPPMGIQNYANYVQIAKRVGLPVMPMDVYMRMSGNMTPSTLPSLPSGLEQAAAQISPRVPTGGVQVDGRMVVDPNPNAPKDSIPAVIDGYRPARLDSGEFVVPRKAVEYHGVKKFLDMIKAAEQGGAK